MSVKRAKHLSTCRIEGRAFGPVSLDAPCPAAGAVALIVDHFIDHGCYVPADPNNEASTLATDPREDEPYNLVR